MAPPARTGGLDRRILLALAAGFVLLLVGGVLLALGRSGGNGELLARVVARQDNLLKLTQDSQPSIRNNDLLKINSDAILLLTSDGASLRGLLRLAGISGLPTAIVQSESDQATVQKLQEAKGNGLFDAAYRASLSQKIDAQQALLRELGGKTANPTIKQVIDTALSNLSNLQNQLAALRL